MADSEGNRYAPYDIEIAGSQAEGLTEDAWYDLFGGISGVKSGGALTFNGLTANLTAIDMRVHGSYLIRQDPWSVASPATPSGGSPRRDMLVARRQRTIGSGAGATPGKTVLILLQGTPAASPAEPTTFNPVTDEPLWSWQVPINGGTVITDFRDLRATLLPSGIKSVVSTTARDRHFPAPVKGDICMVDGIDQVYNGSRWVFTKNGQLSVSTDASAVATVIHDLGVVPLDFQVTRGAFPAANIADARVTALSTTQAQLVFSRTDNGAALASNPIFVYWRAGS